MIKKLPIIFHCKTFWSQPKSVITELLKESSAFFHVLQVHKLSCQLRNVSGQQPSHCHLSHQILMNFSPHCPVYSQHCRFGPVFGHTQLRTRICTYGKEILTGKSFHKRRKQKNIYEQVHRKQEASVITPKPSALRLAKQSKRLIALTRRMEFKATGNWIKK